MLQVTHCSIRICTVYCSTVLNTIALRMTSVANHVGLSVGINTDSTRGLIELKSKQHTRLIDND
jgi:hypothetical protein